MSSKIAQVVVGLPVEGPFDYSVGAPLAKTVAVGSRVRVLFNRRPRVGFVVGFKQKSAFERLNSLLSCLDNHPLLDDKTLQFTREFAAYYGCSRGEAIEIWLPAALRKAADCVWTPPAPTASAAAAGRGQKPVLLNDRGASKRWPVILEMVQKVLTEGRGVIFLVPETSLIDAVVGRLGKEFPFPVTVLDKKVSPRQELSNWLAVREGRARMIIGTRSAVFAPVRDLGLIIVYDEENPAYKQEQTPHYHAPTAAALRAKVEGCSVMYVSAAPSAETWDEARKRKWRRIVLEADRPAAVQVVDMTNYNPQRTSIISFPLQNAIQAALAQNGKVILLMNRKGFTTRTRCQQCGFTMQCPRCNVNLTYLYSKKAMVCRHCNHTAVLPKVCPQCRGAYLRSTGTGTEKLESEVARLYPAARVGDYDAHSEGFPSQADIVIATKAVLREEARDVRLVAVINFDAELHHPDFRAAQHAFTLLVRLRRMASEKLLVQTRMPDNYCLRAAAANDFEGFYKEELGLRRELGFPPYRHLVAVGLRGRVEDLVFQQAQELFARFEEKLPASLEVGEPHPDVNPKLRDKYRFTILLKGRSVKDILAFVKPVVKNFRHKRGTVVTINVDP